MPTGRKLLCAASVPGYGRVSVLRPDIFRLRISMLFEDSYFLDCESGTCLVLMRRRNTCGRQPKQGIPHLLLILRTFLGPSYTILGQRPWMNHDHSTRQPLPHD
jgi:hypothetical protein